MLNTFNLIHELMNIKLEIDMHEISIFLFEIFWYVLSMKFNRLTYFVVIYYFLLQNSAYAYIEPGTLSMIISFIVAIVASITFYIKDIFYKIKRLILKIKKKNN